MGSHRYWGLDGFARTGSGNQWYISEIEMRATPGGADQCNGGTAGGTGNYGGSGFTPDKAFDNNNSTEWAGVATTVSSGRIWYDFGTPVDVQEILYRGSASSVISSGDWIRIVFSDDGTNWRIGSGSFSAIGISSLGEAIIVSGVSDTPPGAVLDAGAPKKLLFARTWPMSKNLDAFSTNQRNVWYGGRGRISGTVKIKGTPNYATHRQVVLHRQRDNVPIAAQWSDPVTGAYQFDWFDPNERYYVVAFDYQHSFRAVIADNLTPDLIS